MRISPTVSVFVFASLCACSQEEASAAPRSGPESQQPGDEQVDGEVPEPQAGPESQQPGDEQVDGEVPEPQATIIRVHNRTGDTRARSGSCSGPPFQYGVRRKDAPPPIPVCSGAPDCDSLAADESVDSTNCSAPACGPPRIVLAAGHADDLVWDGDIKQGSERGCVLHVPTATGTPLVARVCWGEPSGFSDIVNLACQDVEFGYGETLVEVELK
jgi:hypothetical protein